MLVHLVDVSGGSGRDPVEDLDTVRRELELFQPELAAKPQIVAANKMDAVDRRRRGREGARGARDGARPAVLRDLRASPAPAFPQLLEAMWQQLAAGRTRRVARPARGHT